MPHCWKSREITLIGVCLDRSLLSHTHKMELEPLNKLENGTAIDRNKVQATEETKRDTWGNRLEFLFAIIGFTVGIGSIWRFPILCARNGGGAFLIPFFFFLLTCGGPLYYIEVCLGQFSGKSAAAAFEFCPLFKGSYRTGKLNVVLLPASL